MNKKYKWRAILGWTSFIALLCALMISKLPGGEGGGQYLESPDGKAIAHLESLLAPGIYQKNKTVWIELYVAEIEKSGYAVYPENLRMTFIEYQTKDPMYARNLEHPISWNAASTEVTFTFADKKITLQR